MQDLSFGQNGLGISSIEVNKIFSGGLGTFIRCLGNFGQGGGFTIWS